MGNNKFNQFREMNTTYINQADIILGSASYDKGCSCGSGACLAPAKLKELSSYLPSFDSVMHNLEDVKIYDYCDVVYEEGDDSLNYLEKLYKKASEILEYNKFMLFFGGDHSVSISLEKAFYEKYKSIGKHPVIIHIDAHMDILDEYMGSKYSHACPNRRAIENGYDVRDINLIAIRSYEKDEVIFKNNNSDLYMATSDYFRKNGAKKIVEEIKNKYDDNAVFYVSFDIDAVDPGFAPGTGTPESFGLTPVEIRQLFEEIFASLKVEAMDIVEISPNLDVNDVTSWLGLKLLYDIIYFKFIK